VIENPLR